MSSARATAVKLLLKTFENNSYSNFVLDKELKNSSLSAQEKAFCTQLYYGVIERLLTLEYILEVYSNKKPEKLDDPVKYILYLGFYQLKYCDKIPDSASINESVKLAKYFKKKSASGFINAVLRKFQRADKKIPLTTNKWINMQMHYSAPVKLLQKVIAEHGEKFANTFFENSLCPPPCMIRYNNLKKGDLQELNPKPCDKLENAYQITAPDIRNTKAFQQGLFHVQGLSSQFCCKVLNAQAGEIILDMCSAPGGKAFTIAEDMQNQGHVYAFDLHPHRVKLIQQGAERLGLTCVHTDVKNATEYDSNIPKADRILCDVPCSGFGVIRRRPEIKYKSLESIQELPELQYKILENASRYLKSDGILVYSTCTIFAQENQEVIKKFLDNHADFELVALQELNITEGWAVLSAEYADCDGFFIAKLHRKA
ncbi:MAG: 16S rRNA (cytosine(967)-C(5))-methyltransferase RsmB [Oscillospiraceae bacterium]|nr:16S rRNA (cytosine(967)-C(5))-methyltransferase RsmB [Oscillospiraceae bacterium]